MGKNYIDEFMKDNDLKINKKFKFINEKVENICYFDENYILRASENGNYFESIVLGILKNEYKIEKIKPKTLMEQLKEQGYGYVINCDGIIRYIEWGEEKIEGFKIERMILNGSMHLSKSEAERELYRRKLEFEMQEWARENDCLGSDLMNDHQVYAGFLVYIQKSKWELMSHLVSAFNDKVQEYYNWSE